MRGGGGGKLGGIGPRDKVFCLMQFLTLIDHGGQQRPTVIGHGDPIIAKRRDSLICLSLVYDGDRQAPPASSKSFQRFGLTSDPSRWLTHHISYRHLT
jgi:hypothetical protein